MTLSQELRRRREELVVEHMESENRHEFDVTLGTFDHPRYELIGTGDVYDGPGEVARYFEETRAAFPDQRNELISMHHPASARHRARSGVGVGACRDRPEPSGDDRSRGRRAAASPLMRWWRTKAAG